MKCRYLVLRFMHTLTESPRLAGLQGHAFLVYKAEDMTSHSPYTIKLSQERRSLEGIADRPSGPGEEPAESGIGEARVGAKAGGAGPASPCLSQPEPAPAVT